jgi:hypothetical protein
MFNLEKDKRKIGQYILKLITENEKFKNQRRFCQAYLSSDGVAGVKVNDEDTRKMENRMSQIIKGNKSIQIYDLPIFTKLLGVSCEELLSCGKKFLPNDDRLTNYSIAFTKDENLWEEYINDEDKPFLNPDEYSCTVLDYAIKFKNFDFIKYLIDKGYIWFDSEEFEGSYVHDFGAGTSIKGRNIGDFDYYLPHQLCNAKLRMKLIMLSVENNNLDILKALRAREIPDYYNATYFSNCKIEVEKYYNKELITYIANASDEIVDYFTDVFEIGDLIKYKDGIKRNKKFMFLFISEVLDGLIKNNNDFVEFALRKSIEHNRETYNKLKVLITEVLEAEYVRYNFSNDEYSNSFKKEYTKRILDEIYFTSSKNIIALRGNSTERGLITNIVQIKNESKDIKINYLIKDLNTLYDKIVNIKNDFEI